VEESERPADDERIPIPWSDPETESADDERIPWRDPGTAVTAEQLELRRMVLKQAEANPGTFDMGYWELDQECGTTRCVAGWAQFLVRGEVFPNGDTEQGIPVTGMDAITLLGLSYDDFYRGSGLTSGLFYARESGALEQLRKLAAVAEAAA
jgi:hypothetical protein